MTIKIQSGFMSCLDKCPDCGDEHDVAQQVECRACRYHAGGDLGAEWIGHCEEELNGVGAGVGTPAGVEVLECHEPEGHGDKYTMTFEIADSADVREVFNFLVRLSGGSVTWYDPGGDEQPEPLTIGDMLALESGCANPLHPATGRELEEIIRETTDLIEVTDQPWLDDVYAAKKSAEDALRDLPNLAKPETWVGQDEDGYWFREVRREEAERAALTGFATDAPRAC